MRLFLRWLAVVVLGGAVAAAADAPVVPIRAGPVFTRGETAGPYPRYPDVEIQVEVPPATSPALVTPDAFRLKADNGSPVNATRVQTLASTGYGVAVSVSLDVSGSMKGAPLNAVRSGLVKFVSAAGPRDKVAIQTIADQSRWDANWDDSRDKVSSALNGLSTRGTLTRLWDGLLDAIGHFPQTPLSQRLIVISDGHDEGSVHSEDDVIAAAREHGIVVDAIGMTRSSPVYLQNLQRLAAQTGGQFRHAGNVSDLDFLVGDGVDRLKSTPVVGFRLDNLPADGGVHHFQVIWKHQGSESQAEVMASIPQASVSLRRGWVAAAGIAAVVVVVLLIVAASMGKSRKPIGAPTQSVPAPVDLTPPPTPTPLPPRQHRGTPAPIRSPLEAEKVSSATGEPAPTTRSKTEILARFPSPAAGRPAAWLFCEEGFAPGERFPVEHVEYWIGSIEGNHLHIANDPTVSAHHACLVFDHEVLGIYDHHSTNGTSVNDELVSENRRLLRPGDRIRVGQSIFTVQSAGQEGLRL